MTWTQHPFPFRFRDEHEEWDALFYGTDRADATKSAKAWAKRLNYKLVGLVPQEDPDALVQHPDIGNSSLPSGDGGAASTPYPRSTGARTQPVDSARKDEHDAGQELLA